MNLTFVLLVIQQDVKFVHPFQKQFENSLTNELPNVANLRNIKHCRLIKILGSTSCMSDNLYIDACTNLQNLLWSKEHMCILFCNGNIIVKENLWNRSQSYGVAEHSVAMLKLCKATSTVLSISHPTGLYDQFLQFFVTLSLTKIIRFLNRMAYRCK